MRETYSHLNATLRLKEPLPSSGQTAKAHDRKNGTDRMEIMTSWRKWALFGAFMTWSVLLVYLLSSLKTSALHLRRTEAPRSNELIQNTQPISQRGFTTPVPTIPAKNKNIRLELPIQIVIAANSLNLGGLIAAANSVVQNTQSWVQFYFLTPLNDHLHLKKWLQHPLLKKIKYKWAPLEDVSLAKVEFLTSFPDLQGQIIYLDNDVIVQGDIHELWQTRFLSESLYAAFPSDCLAQGSFKGKDNFYAGRINFKHPAASHLLPSACTFNTGVFLTNNVTLWHQTHILAQVKSLLSNNSTEESLLGPKGDSDEVAAAFLVLFYKKITFLDPSWHVGNLGMTTAPRYSPKFLTKAKLLHWNGYWKPWGRRAVEVKLWETYFVPDPSRRFKLVRRS